MISRFRRFSVRVLALVLGLLFAVLAATYIFVSRANVANAVAHAESRLDLAARMYEHNVRARIGYLAGYASQMSGDYAIRQVLLKDPLDVPTLTSNLQSYVTLTGAPVIALFKTDGTLVADSMGNMSNENAGPFAHLIERASLAEKPEASDFAYIEGKLHVLVVVPLYAPVPNIAYWFGLAFPIDEAFAREIKDSTQVDLTFVDSDANGRTRVLATTVPPGTAAELAILAALNRKDVDPLRQLTLDGAPHVALFKPQGVLGDDPVFVVLQRSLVPDLAAARELQNRLVVISLAALAVATLVALLIARSVSQPVQQLAAHTEAIAAGDYTTRIELNRADELAQLATAMNRMSAGLAERDRVRDLLDKNVSPAVAAQLLRDGAALGGQERVVTILFVDLRNFTTLSERLTPPELLALLNRYLDRMSGVVEAHGGVIDKFIGDAIMALFGAPVDQPDSADRALRCARALVIALAELNRELATTAQNALQFGIGLNTARVVAGNIGSHRRLNYSVIGDGVNIAARLQSETRKAEHRATIITSAATLAAATEKFPTRPLGPVQVKGRAEPIEIFAVD